jgi:hypothetical protein
LDPEVRSPPLSLPVPLSPFPLPFLLLCVPLLRCRAPPACPIARSHGPRVPLPRWLACAPRPCARSPGGSLAPLPWPAPPRPGGSPAPQWLACALAAPRPRGPRALAWPRGPTSPAARAPEAVPSPPAWLACPGAARVPPARAAHSRTCDRGCVMFNFWFIQF